MEPIIYALPKSEYNIDPSVSETVNEDLAALNIFFDTHANPKLIKYGFNNIANQLNMLALTSTPYYKAGLEFDFDRKDSNSITTKANLYFKNKNFDQTFGEFWEILTLFNLLENTQTIYSMRNSATVKEVTDTYQKILGNKINYNILTGVAKTPVNLVIHKYSDIDIDENAAVEFIINDLPNLLKLQKIGSNMILQFFSLQTQITAEIIYMLSMLYTEAYLIKPIIVSDLSDIKYLVLVGLRQTFNLVIPKHSNDLFISSLGLKQMSSKYDTIIQCMNSDILPKKYKRYNIIKSYLDTKVYEGATYNDFIKAQDDNAQKWLETFGNLDNSKQITDDSIKKTDARCNTYGKLINILN